MQKKHHENYYNDFCTTLIKNKIYRNLIPAKTDFINFQSNDYLNLSQNPVVINRCIEYAKKYGTGVCASRAIINREIYTKLETKISIGKKSPTSILFNTGYQGNLTAISSLLDKKILKDEPLVFSDRLNHNSMHVACDLAGVRQLRYSHLDMTKLESLLQKHKQSNKPKFILSETVFGMDGDCLKIEDIVFLAKKYNAFLYLDEAHATGLYGENGYGLSTKYSESIDCVFGSFSKAIGSFGSYVCCSENIKKYFINRCYGFIYSTSLPPPIIGAVDAAWDQIPLLQKQRDSIMNNAKYLKKTIEEISDLECLNNNTNIVSIIFPDIDSMFFVKNELEKNNIAVSAIRHPTVPINSPRIRIAICAQHTQNEIDLLIENFCKICKKI